MSGRKNSLLQWEMLVGATMATTVTSPVTNINFLDNIGIQVNITSGSPNGILQVQVSADYNQDNQGNVLNPGNWVNLVPGAATISSGSPAQVYFDLNQLSAPWVRLVYSPTSGSGTMNAFITAKMI